jgi:hypothetical protein
MVEPDMYALLDGRNIEGDENTVVLGIALSSMYDRDPEVMTEEKKDEWMLECDRYEDAPKDFWREFRVVFTEAEKLVTVLMFESDFTQKLYNDEFVAKYTDERGVFQVARAQHAWETPHTGLTDE